MNESTSAENDQTGMQQKIQDKASEFGNRVQDQAETRKDKAAEGLEQAAEQMRNRVERQGGMQGEVGAKVADSLERSASYLREHEVDQIWDDLEEFVKDHPIQAAVGAAFAGFVVARILR